MKKIGFLIFAAALVIGLVVANMFSFGHSSSKVFNFSFNMSGVKGSGVAVKESRSLSDFESVDVGGVFQVEITAQKDFGVEVEADDNILGLIKTEVRDGVLYIETEQRVSPSTPMKIRVSCPNVERLEATGASNVTIAGLKNNELSVDSSGASKVKISGETAKLTVEVSGATKIDAEELKAVDAEVEASGASSVTVNVSGDLRSEANGASKILYAGTPVNVEKSTHGASRVSQK